MVKWNEVTWYSKLAAVILFVGIIPAIFFYIGMQYQQFISSTNESIVSSELDKEQVEQKNTEKKQLEYASPDGRYIAKMYTTEEITDTYIEDNKGNEIVSKHAGSFKSWFPDNKQLLLFVASMYSPDQRRHMYILTIDGKYFDTGLPAGTYDAAYRQSDDSFVYTLERYMGSDAADIYIRDVNGTDRLLVKGDSNIFVGLAWSEDGKKIFFTKNNLKGDNLGTWEINEDGTGLAKLSEN